MLIHQLVFIGNFPALNFLRTTKSEAKQKYVCFLFHKKEGKMARQLFSMCILYFYLVYTVDLF